MRAYHSFEAAQNVGQLGQARAAVDVALVDAAAGGDEPLLRLRAVQLEDFLEALRRFESTGEETDELSALGGGFVRSMKIAGWCDGYSLVPREPADPPHAVQGDVGLLPRARGEA